jgi:beta-galactosidase
MGRGYRQNHRPAGLNATADRNLILADGKDLSFVTVRVIDQNWLTVLCANVPIQFSIEGPGEIVATDNGDPTNLVLFSSHESQSFNGLALAIVRSRSGNLV